MARPPKHDWIKLKEDWLFSELSELSVYFANLESPIPKHTYKRNTVGWREEKEALKGKLSSTKIEKALENPEVQKEKAKILALQNKMRTGCQIILNRLIDLFAGRDSQLEKYDTKDAIMVLNAIKTELGEATTISKNQILGSGENGAVKIENTLNVKFQKFK